MRVEKMVCDRCERRIEDESGSWVNVRYYPVELPKEGGRRVHRGGPQFDLCAECSGQLDSLLKNWLAQLSLDNTEEVAILT